MNRVDGAHDDPVDGSTIDQYCEVYAISANVASSSAFRARV